MNGNVENLVLEHLRAIRAGMGRMEAQLVEVNARLLSVEKAVLKPRSDNLDTQEDVYRQQIQYDRLAERVWRIEKRLELCDPQFHIPVDWIPAIPAGMTYPLHLCITARAGAWER